MRAPLVSRRRLAVSLLLLAPSSFAAWTADSEAAARARVLVFRRAARASNAGWTPRLNPIAALPDGERLALAGDLDVPGAAARAAAPAPLEGRQERVPDRLDWRNVEGKDYVGPVRDQTSRCGSCWAFAVTGALESYLRRTDRFVEAPNLSEQALLSCSGAGDCRHGGYSVKALGYLRSAGLPAEDEMPYAASDAACPPSAAEWAGTGQRVGDIGFVPRRVEDLKRALALYGPLVASMKVYEDFYSYYPSLDAAPEVYRHIEALGGEPADVLLRLLRRFGRHAVLLVGYDDGLRAFIVKNSWGEQWGYGGYFLIGYSEVDGDVEFGSNTLALLRPRDRPDVLIRAPSAGEHLAGSVRVSAASSAPGDAWLEVDGATVQPMRQDLGEYVAELDADALAPGQHRLTVHVRDRAGGVGTALVSFKVGDEAPSGGRLRDGAGDAPLGDSGDNSLEP